MTRSRATEWWTAGGLYVLNVFDMVVTMVAIRHGASESNPFMRLLIELDMACFIFYKVAVVGFFTLLLLVLPVPRRTLPFLYALSVVYGLLTVYHLWGLCG